MDPARDCPILDGRALAEYRASKKAASALGVVLRDFLQARSREEQAAWLKLTVESGRLLFQPWTMEIVFALAVLGSARYNQLLEGLGLSSRTLSDKLAALRAEGLVERLVHDEQPVRIEYRLTKHGLATAALATPLFSHLNLEALRRAGRLPAGRASPAPAGAPQG